MKKSKQTESKMRIKTTKRNKQKLKLQRKHAPALGHRA